jgi:hypothetical protein
VSRSARSAAIEGGAAVTGSQTSSPRERKKRSAAVVHSARLVSVDGLEQRDVLTRDIALAIVLEVCFDSPGRDIKRPRALAGPAFRALHSHGKPCRDQYKRVGDALVLTCLEFRRDLLKQNVLPVRRKIQRSYYGLANYLNLSCLAVHGLDEYCDAFTPTPECDTL